MNNHKRKDRKDTRETELDGAHAQFEALLVYIIVHPHKWPRACM